MRIGRLLLVSTSLVLLLSSGCVGSGLNVKVQNDVSGITTTHSVQTPDEANLSGEVDGYQVLSLSLVNVKTSTQDVDVAIDLSSGDSSPVAGGLENGSRTLTIDPGSNSHLNVPIGENASKVEVEIASARPG